MEPETLRTARLELSAPHDGDVAAIHAECQDAAIQRFTTVPAPYLPADAETFVELARGWWAEGAEATWAIRLDGRLVGMAGLAKLPSGAPRSATGCRRACAVGVWRQRPPARSSTGDSRRSARRWPASNGAR